MRVVHINVRLSEGGAAKIALDLHKRSLKDGIKSQFFYGYGMGAKRSIFHSSVAEVVQLANRPNVMVNYATHRICGVELLPPCKKKASLLRQAVRDADVVHLHAIHSYFAPFGWLSDVLTEARRIIWTCHDYWPITGRCAFLEGCNRWKSGCGSCPSGLNYPPVFFDLSAYLFKNKRAEIMLHMDRIIFVAPSKFVSEQFKEAFPDTRVEVVYNGIDSDLERELTHNNLTENLNFGGPIKVLVIANDLADPTKVDRTLIKKVISLLGVELHTIGKNSPFQYAQVVNHGEIRQRTELINIMKHMHTLLFTSRKDTFGLVMVEAMACGVPVLALQSDAAQEVLKLVGARTVDNDSEILSCISNQSWWNLYPFGSKEKLESIALTRFSGNVMYGSYKRLYML